MDLNVGILLFFIGCFVCFLLRWCGVSLREQREGKRLENKLPDLCIRRDFPPSFPLSLAPGGFPLRWLTQRRRRHPTRLCGMSTTGWTQALGGHRQIRRCHCNGRRRGIQMSVGATVMSTVRMVIGQRRSGRIAFRTGQQRGRCH